MATNNGAAVADKAEVSLACVKGCGKVLRTTQAKTIHERACKFGEIPLSGRDYSKLGLEVRTAIVNVWFFRPPQINSAGTSSTALPEDVFYDSDGWATHHLDTQVRKEIETGYAGAQKVLLVTPVHAHERLKNGTPIVGFGPPDAEVWDVICDLLERAREPELVIEKMRLEDIGRDLEKMTQADGKSALRNTARVLKARIKRLEAGYDFDALYQFFEDESRRSLAPLRSPEDVFANKVEEIVMKALSEITD